MVYPDNFEAKVGFDVVRRQLSAFAESALGREEVGRIAPLTDAAHINRLMGEGREFARLMESDDAPAMDYIADLRESTSRLRLEGTYMEEEELLALRRLLVTVDGIAAAFNKSAEGEYAYPLLHALAEDVAPLTAIERRIEQVIDEEGHIRDDASAELHSLRRQLSAMEGSISRTLHGILKTAQADGLVDKDASPTLRDGRLVIPVAPALKRKIKGIVHDESASGKTVFIEPAEVVEANNRVRELEAAERREVIRILKEVADTIRPHLADIARCHSLTGAADLMVAKRRMAMETGGVYPDVESQPLIDWTLARHPLLQQSLQKQGRKPVPLDIRLDANQRMLIISGPNAGGKSVCLKTVGLLQYMVQCGLPIPVGESSRAGLFLNIMIDIGDEQSIDDDLSTYSSHLANMKAMMRRAGNTTLLLIDEFGSGTEPKIGGAIAEAVLRQLWGKGAFGVITTHYHNLKHFADDHEGVANGAMLYDRHEMKPLFQLAVGMPGSSFAIEMARKTGLPEQVISDATELVGSEYIQSDKFLQDIVRDKRYWESKRQAIHQREKDLEAMTARYEQTIGEIEQSRRDILARAKQQAEELLAESNRRIENTIREIRESQAAKEETRKTREELKAFRQEVDEMDTNATDDLIAKKMQQLQERRERKRRRRMEKARQAASQEVKKPAAEKSTKEEMLQVGDTVRIKGMKSIGKVERVEGSMATVIFGAMRSKMPVDRLLHAEAVPQKQEPQPWQTMAKGTRDALEQRRLSFQPDIDVRGMRGEEALTAVGYFIDDAVVVGMKTVRILHGTGTGTLRHLIRQYLATVPNVETFNDEHVEFGGAGITVVNLS